MKQLIIPMVLMVMTHFNVQAQSKTDAISGIVVKLDKARSVKDFESFEMEFVKLANADKASWLPYYYAAFCNAKIGFLLADDGEKIEAYSKRGEEQIKKAASLVNSSGQKKELAEIYTVTSMIYRTMVFINPMTYGAKYGPVSQKYLEQAKELDGQNPRALWLAAWVKYNTPKLWGGDKNLAKQLANESLGKLKETRTDSYPHWGKMEVIELLSKYK